MSYGTHPERQLHGEVTKIIWADHSSSLVSIPATDVTTEGTWYAVYSWDGDDKTLTLAEPTQSPPPRPAASSSKAASDPVDIGRIHIKSWGESNLATPLEWTGTVSGAVAKIVFVPGFAQTSGPVGTVEGP
jgi:hypothetical protein